MTNRVVSHGFSLASFYFRTGIFRSREGNFEDFHFEQTPRSFYKKSWTQYVKKGMKRLCAGVKGSSREPCKIGGCTPV